MPVNDELSTEQISVLYGALLGDGCLSVHKNGMNAVFCYLSHSYQHTQFIQEYFKEYVSSEIYKYTFFDVRTNHEYTNYSFKTLSNSTFTEIYNCWYHNGIKKIPQNLKLNPLICLIWYIGDGSICNVNRTQYIKLSTHCFSKEDQENILLPQLSQFEAKLMKASLGKNGEQQYFIYIPRRKIKDFLNYIGDCPFDDYQYKWAYKEYKNAMPRNHTAHENEFCEMYKSGMTYYAIAKQFNIEPNAVKYYLKKNQLYRGTYNENY